MSVPTPPCPNCGLPNPAGAAVCPNCGYTQGRAPSWPPPPTGFIAPPPPPVGPLLTGKVKGDLALGIGFTVVVYSLTVALAVGLVPGALASPVYGLGFFVPLALYFAVRPFYPTLSRGLGRGGLVFLALLFLGLALTFLGLLIVCSQTRRP